LDRRARVLVSAISVLLVLSLSQIVFNEAFAGSGFPRTPLPTDGPIGDFRCWGAQGATSFVTAVDVEDQFGFMEQAFIGEPIEFCASAEKRFDNKIFESPFGINPGQHFTAYRFTSPIPLPNPEVHSVFIPQFDLFIPEIIMSSPLEILVPTTKIIPDPNPQNPPIVSPSQTDLHYKCYLIEEPPLVTLPAFSLATQFDAEDFAEGQFFAFLFCNPAIKIDGAWNPPEFGELIDEHLICFLNIQQDSHSILIDNQFTLTQQLPLLLNGKQKICLEALKDFNPPVGGQMVPIDTTALLVAGAQSTTWMIPVALSLVGIGLVFYRKRI
jgi:hypothetical protein